ncbi:hypothetical protein EDD11_006944 [Mortierella claussenii]|nr:hypothetical protein EDD11_006944 [Mortierella claussenii]
MTMMQRYLTHPDDPDSEADIAVQIMISQAAVDSKGFEILMPQTVETVKRHHATLISRIAALTARLSLESKIREAAQSLLKLHADNKKLARQASDHLEAANQKVDQVATELWKLTQLAADLQRTLLQHTSGVLALGVVRLEDQGRREREMHVVQLQEARVGRDVEDQFESMAKVIMSLESGALEAQKLLEDKDRAIERLLKQLEHQRDLFIKLDEQQRKTMALSRSQRKSLEASGGTGSDAKTIAKLSDFLSSVQKQLQQILQQQQQQVSTTKRQRNTPADQQDVDGSPVSDDSATEAPQQRDGFAQTCPSNSTMMSRTSPSVGSLREDSMSSGPSDRSYRTTGIHAGSDTLMDSPTPTTPLGPGTTPFSMEGIQSTLDALKSHVTESKQKITTLEGELGLMRRQSVVMSASRNNSIKIKNFSTSSSRGHQAEETIRSALEKSLKDALLAKEMAQLELENERQKWQEDQNHRISALEESLVAVEDLDKDSGAKSRTGAGGMVSAVGLDTTRDDRMLSRDETVKELRRQLRDAMEDIDSLSLQQQSSLKAMRQLFDLLPNSRRRSHMQLFESHQQSQQEIATSLNDQSRKSDMADPSSSSSSSPPAFSAIGFSMEALISRVKDLVTSSQQIEQDNAELRQQVGKPMIRSRQTSSQNLAVSSNPGPQGNSESRGQSTWMLNSDLERLQANAGMVQLLEKELELLKQHTDVLMDENARLADLAAASATNTPVQVRSSVLGRIVQKPSQDDKLNELQKIIRAKDELLLERDQIVQDLEKSLQQTQLDLTQARAGTGDTTAEIADGISRPDSPLLSTFDINAAEEMRIKCEKLEEEMGEMRMVVAALESVNGGPGTGLQLLKGLAASSNSQSSSSSSWLGSTLGAVGSLSFGSFSQRNSIETASSATSPVPSTVDMSNNDNKSNTLSPGGSGSNNAAVTGATAALRKEFRRAMGELREEKEKAVRKEIEERRRLERELRKLRRELQIAQTTTQA